jgi:hypothetical protein
VCAVAFASGCYHATINTGLSPSGETVTNKWAHSFLAGLVPPDIVNTAAQCPNGVAKVETQHSFLNMVAQVVTFSIYSPMTIDVQCATQRSAMNTDSVIRVSRNAAAAQQSAALASAARESLATDEPLYVIFE